jgi:hypothetical protein
MLTAAAAAAAANYQDPSQPACVLRRLRELLIYFG